MAKKDKKKDKKEPQGVEHDAVAAVRAAVERTLQLSTEGAQSTRDRTREIVDDIAQAAGRIRHTLEDMRVLDEVKSLRREVETLAARVASLELPGRSESAPVATPDPAAPAAARPATARKVAARKPAAKRTATARKPAAVKPPAATAKPATARKRAAAAKPAAPPTT